ncbi:exodeoxyribonuclease V subunit alpha [Candidatus Enterovibrio escicola]|uniref:RecBCD enzyme subunit RecD n=1 Tax=Candidatus Enterovibrio escicola TaxID=1927127 RepID=A0A2A5T606_9GAMM|nr:exodeoxyribonuclease V subunit alpha [Candidatus Enterovibrio escacola]PCS23639.1 Exodeoxyribonuclease V alpha chain [Candidatus Enterovibrio escacola]
MLTSRELLQFLYHRRTIRAIDRQFALFIGQQLGDLDIAMVGWAALVSYELGKGNVCIDLSSLDVARLFDLPASDSARVVELLKPQNAIDMFLRVSVVGNGDTASPLVLDGTRLYLHRYWCAERCVANEIKKRAVLIKVACDPKSILDDLFAPDIADLKIHYADWESDVNLSHVDRQQKLVDYLDITSPEQVDFGALVALLKINVNMSEYLALIPDSMRLNWQKVAAAVALCYRFSVISGGPGTGKTTTVAKLLAALIFSSDKPTDLEIKLVAPTGKAANRLAKSISQALVNLPVSQSLREKIPIQASTIHSLLGVIMNRVKFRHYEGNRLHLDILVVDEASMVDLPLMARLLSALPDHARVILLGDRDQLASVEAGAVLGDICINAKNIYSATCAEQLSALTGFSLACFNANQPVTDSVCLLKKSYRFHTKSGVGQLAFAINAGDSRRLQQIFAQGYDDIAFHEMDSDVYTAAVHQAVEGYREYLNALSMGETMSAVLHKFSAVRLLCALSEGQFGVAGFNREIENALVKERLIILGKEKSYLGRPVMVTQNDHGLGLYNGDIGIVVKQEDSLRVVFEMPNGRLKTFLPSRLPEHKTAYAITIHKSQGSEFSHIILVLPPMPTPVMTRELVYTGVTRAIEMLDIYATCSSLEIAVRRKTHRFSGLAEALSTPLNLC